MYGFQRGGPSDELSRHGPASEDLPGGAGPRLALKLEFDLDDARLESLIEELVDVQQVAAREGKVLSWVGSPDAEREAPTGTNRGDPGDCGGSSGS